MNVFQERQSENLSCYPYFGAWPSSNESRLLNVAFECGNLEQTKPEDEVLF